jgi:mannosyltransferase OCH1-like enzyme
MANNKDTTEFNYSIKYIDDVTFEIVVNITKGSEVTLEFLNKNGKEIYSYLFSQKQTTAIMNSSFLLIKDTNNYIGKIPKIIHQSYTKTILTRLRNATYTWSLMNNNYKYMYWSDEDCDEYIYKTGDEKIKEAYFSLHARAYKSDIFRLCILYEYGGIWADISSECNYPLDNLITNDINLMIVKDNPSQVTNGNIYQAFIAVEQKNEIIKFVLDLTVDRIINFKQYEITYPWIHNETIAVTGPTIFAIALNNFLERPSKTIFNDKIISFGSNKILLLDHTIENNVGYISHNTLKVIRTKYENYQKDRTTPHYSHLFSQGYIVKKKIPLTNINNIKVDSNNLFQIWISNDKYGQNYVTEKMYQCYTTWKGHNPEINHIFLNNETIIEIIKNDTDFPNLLEAYTKVKVFAFKADLIRYYLLYKYGGAYVDIDSYCVNPLKGLINEFDVVLSYDCEKTSISQAFIYSKNPRVKLFELLIKNAISNILSENISNGDTGITGPALFGKVAQHLFHYLEKGSEFIFENLKVKIINYCLNLPLPSGDWKTTSINNSVSSNVLTTYCKTSSAQLVKNVVRFLPHNNLLNNNGKIVGNTNAHFSYSDGSGFYMYQNIIYCVSKYESYNKDRIILGGNDFANMFQNRTIFN